MHTMKMLSAGFALLGLLLFLAPRLNRSGAHPIAYAVKLFIPLWLAVSLINLVVGVTRAGYTVLEEAPILLIVFGIPMAIALLLRWFFGKASA